MPGFSCTAFSAAGIWGFLGIESVDRFGFLFFDLGVGTGLPCRCVGLLSAAARSTAFSTSLVVRIRIGSFTFLGHFGCGDRRFVGFSNWLLFARTRSTPAASFRPIAGRLITIVRTMTFFIAVVVEFYHNRHFFLCD